jgi:hypothetical protein
VTVGAAGAAGATGATGVGTTWAWEIPSARLKLINIARMKKCFLVFIERPPVET